MWRVGKRDDQKDLYAALKSAHRIAVRLWLLDSNGNHVKNLSGSLVDGVVTVDSNAEITRALDLTLFDPGGQIRITPDNPSRYSIFIADQIKAIVIVSSADRKKVWAVPVFTGPVDSVDRDNYIINIKCLGKEALSINNLWRGRTFRKGQRKTDVIQEILTDLIGETQTNIPDLPAKLPGNIKLSHDKSPWKVAKKLARSMGYQLFYNGDGVATMRKMGSRRPVIRLTGDWITTKPKAAYDLNKTINAVHVRGRKHKKGKKRIEYRAVAKRSHPLSPWSIGRNGTPRYLWLEIDDDSITTKSQAKKVARGELRSGLLAGIQVSFSGLSLYTLQEQDIVVIDVDDYAGKTRMDSFTIPLVAGVDQTYNFLKRTRPKGNPVGIRRPKRSQDIKGHKR